MIQSLRERFNASWTDAQFARFRSILEAHAGAPLGFPLSETPCFFPRSLMNELTEVARELIRQSLESPDIQAAPDYRRPGRFDGPGAEATPTFLQVDFGLVRNADGTLAPKLVELQAFASLYGFQLAVARAYQEAFSLSESLSPFLGLPAEAQGAKVGGLDLAGYNAIVGDAILNGHDPKEVVLLEIEPRQQKTWPDFAVTEKVWGVRAIDTKEVIRDGDRLFYQRDGRRVPIKRIYNRVIPDEQERKGVFLPFDYAEEIDVEWAGHPQWYFRISKFCIPFLKHPSVPKTMFLDEIDRLPEDRDRWLLKPLYSFAGGGIVFSPSDADIAAVHEHRRHEYILQERIRFEPVIDTPDGPTQAEIRMMFVKPPGGSLQPVLPLIRMGRGKMMGVDHNKGLRWVGASAALIDNSR
jgi:hypothetical protein